MINFAASFDDQLSPVAPFLFYVVVAGIVFIETAFLVGFFLPGDSLLFVAGIAASGSALNTVGVQLSLPLLLVLSPIAAFLGTQTGFLFGRRFGRGFFNRPDGKIFSAAKVHHAEEWLHKYGPFKAMMLEDLFQSLEH